jgi:uncharacterized protein YgiM (DUF1202 family)
MIGKRIGRRIRNGAELAVLDQRDNWLQVTDGSGRIWLAPTQAGENFARHLK